MKAYELSILVHPDLEMNLDPVLDKVKKLIESTGGKITKEESDGKKKLSYTIAKQDFGVYYFYTVELPADAPNKISSVLNITDEILRFLLVKEDPRRAKYEARRKEAEANREGAESNDNESTEEGEE